MHRREFLQAVGCGAAIVTATGLSRSMARPANRPSSVKAPEGRPNVVFLMADDHRAFSMGCAGNRQIETPNLDRLADRGVLFDRCYATSPLCMASRATVFTGMYEYKTGCNFATGKLSGANWNNLSYAVLLRQAGYRTAFAGKWGFPLDVPDYPKHFDKWGGFQGAGQGSYTTAKNPSLKPYAKKHPHVTRALGAFGQDFIRESAAAGKPFCLSLSFKAPHKPHNVIDPADQKRYRGVTLDRPASFGEKGLDRLPIQAKLGRQYYQRKEWDEAHYQAHLTQYYQLISGVDAAVGMVVEELARQGVADNTVIIYTSDNGYFCGAHGLQGKVLPYDDASRIPLIVVDPRAASAGKKLRSNAIVGNIDFAPTILSLAGLAVPAKMDGKSLTSLIDAPTGSVRESMLLIQNWGWGNNDHNRGLAVVADSWKYIFWCYADPNVPPAEELFDLRTDPAEMTNLAGRAEASETLQKMRALYDEHHAHWSKHCVESVDYTRHRKTFDRNVPWREKAYRGFPKGGKSGSATALKGVYKELTGHAGPK